MISVSKKLLPLAIAMVQLPVVAQESALEEIIVTARKRVESQQEVPVAVTTVSGEELGKMGMIRFEDLEMANPNVKISPASGSAVATTVGIRGNLQNDITTQLDPSIGTYLDGMILARTFGTSASMVDVQSVQTLKGPQGTLFGRNTTGGAILISTVDPSIGEGVSGYVRGEFGTEDVAAVEAAVDIPLGESAAIRLAGQHREWGDYLEYNDGTEVGQKESQTLRAKLLWNVSDRTSLKFLTEHSDIDANAATQAGVQPNDAQVSGLDNIAGVFPTPTLPGISTGADIITPHVATDEHQTVESSLYVFEVLHETSVGDVKFLTGYRDLDVESIASLPPGLGFTRQDKPDLESFSAELQFNGLFMDDRLELTSGLYYFDESTNEDQETSTYEEIREVISIFPEVVSRTIAEANSESLSAYIQGDYAITEKARLTLGGRYTSDERSMEGSAGQLGDPGTPLVYDYDESDFNYLVSFDYMFSDDVMAYIKTGTGYRSGGASLAADPDRPGFWGEFAPEEVTNYEIGLKSEWLDNRLRFNTAVFSQDYENYQYTAISVATGVPTRLATTTDAKISGAEIELTAVLFADLILDLSYGYTDAEIDGGEIDGDPLPNIPENTFSAALSWNVSTSVGEFDLRAIYNKRDETYSQVTYIEESTTDDRELLNLSATYTNGPWMLSAYVNNALDEEYYTGLAYSPSSPRAFGLFGLSFATVGLPRVAGLRVGYEF